MANNWRGVGLRFSMRLAVLSLLAFAVAPVGLAFAQGSAVCRQLEARLAQASSSGPADPFADAVASQRTELTKVSAQLRVQGCNGGNEAPSCEALRDRAQKMTVNLSQLEARANRTASGSERTRLLAMLDQNNCRANQRQQMVIAPQQQQRPAAQQAPVREARAGGTFLDFLFGDSGLFGGSTSRPQTATRAPGAFSNLFPGGDDEQPQIIFDETKRGALKAVCVRTCDGSFFPVSPVANVGSGGRYGDMCASQCPGTETEVFYMRGDDIATATSDSGQGYMSLKNALKFRKSFDKTCSCRPAGMSWADVMARDGDPTLRPGDLVVSERQAKLMSMPAEHRKTAEVALREEERQKRAEDLVKRNEERLTRLEDKSLPRSRLTQSVSLDGEPVAPPGLPPSEPQIGRAEMRGTNAPALGNPVEVPRDLPVAEDKNAPSLPTGPVRVIGLGSFTPVAPARPTEPTGSLRGS